MQCFTLAHDLPALLRNNDWTVCCPCSGNPCRLDQSATSNRGSPCTTPGSSRPTTANAQEHAIPASPRFSVRCEAMHVCLLGQGATLYDYMLERGHVPAGGQAAAHWSTRVQSRRGLARPGVRTSAAWPRPFQQPRLRPPRRWARAGQCRCRCLGRTSSSPAA